METDKDFFEKLLASQRDEKEISPLPDAPPGDVQPPGDEAIKPGKQPLSKIINAQHATEMYCYVVSKMSEIGYKLATQKKVSLKFIQAEKNMLEPLVAQVLDFYKMDVNNPLSALLLSTGMIVVFKIGDVENLDVEKTESESDDVVRKKRGRPKKAKKPDLFPGYE